MPAVDEQQIRATVEDYYEGWYDADVTRMDRALHADLVKRWAGSPERPFGPTTTKRRMLELTAAGEGRAERGATPTEIRTIDVHRDIACVLVRSGPYREYLHVLRTPEGWRIVGALWQYDGGQA